ncbi:hypothetical protein BX661DRAFT_180329 [Kickxella alabastrina]|uniref:uncharacterized protein n=1 Tax=Kickxella alabastrina TaxID=61397 RepID=UPI00222116BE|nr:uncharacterized protein BX661DRAFT_180329 [Kickxella alabastrina]KAI7830926.1 hypothetical protein BX661DRAFT_180329 [Kickxella alabastrina]
MSSQTSYPQAYGGSPTLTSRFLRVRVHGISAPSIAQGCTGNHAPGAFGAAASNALSALRQTNQQWRSAALQRGATQVVGSSRWARRNGQLAQLHALHGHRVRRLVFRAADYFREGRSDSAALLAALDAFLALGWPAADAVAVEWFSGLDADHRSIAKAIARWTPGVRDVFVRDKGASLGRHLWGADPLRVRRLAIEPYGGGGGAEASLAVARVGLGRLTALSVGGRDFSAELLAALQQWQPRLATLTVTHAWLGALRSAAAAAVVLGSVRHLQLEHVVAEDGELPLCAAMFPQLESLVVRHVWAPSASRSALRGASFGAQQWPRLHTLALPAVADRDAQWVARACPRLQRLATHSLDYAGPRLTATGLAALLRVPALRHLAIEQRRADGAPGYDVLDAALVRLLTPSAPMPGAMVRRASTVTLGGSGDEAEAYARVRAARRLPLDAAHPQRVLLGRQPRRAAAAPAAVVCASLSLRTEDEQLGFLKGSRSANKRQALLPPPPHALASSLRSLALTADADILTDAQWLAAWLARHFPGLRECRTNHARSHHRAAAALRSALPDIVFSQQSSRAPQGVNS